MAEVITVIFYDVIDHMVGIEHLLVDDIIQLSTAISTHELHTDATLNYYNDIEKVAFAISGVDKDK